VPEETDARVAVLKRWSDAGVVLGNHTYSHADFNSLSVPQFEDEIIHGEVVTRRLMEGRRPYQLYFRFPETHGGDTADKKQAVETFLTERGYKSNARYFRDAGGSDVALALDEKQRHERKFQG
jgi:peptidoglycan/xylan/chitin deacetylase (PgdA/CDA1 family)